MRNLSQLGIQVPENLSIVSCKEDEKYSSGISPHVTGIALPMYAIGKSAFQQVTKLAVEGLPRDAALEMWPVHLVERGSVRRV